MEGFDLPEQGPKKCGLRFVLRTSGRLGSLCQHKISRVNQGSRRLQLNSEDHTRGLAYFDAPRKKVDSGLNSSDLYPSRLWIRRIDRNRYLCVPQIDGI